MRALKYILITFVLMLSIGTVLPAPVHAFDPFGGIDCSGAADSAQDDDAGDSQGAATNKSAVCADRDKTDNPLTGPGGLILKIVNIVAIATGAIAIIVIVLAGLRFVTSGGSSEDVAGARRSLLYAIVGLVVIILARTIVAYIIEKL